MGGLSFLTASLSGTTRRGANRRLAAISRRPNVVRVWKSSDLIFSALVRLNPLALLCTLGPLVLLSAYQLPH